MFHGDKPVQKIEIKTRRFLAYKNYYLLYKDRVIETMGNVQQNKLGSSIFNSNADLWGVGFFDESKIITPLIFNKKPFVIKLKELLDKGICREYDNEKTDGLYNSRYAKVPEKYIIPYSVKNLMNDDPGQTKLF